VSGESDEESSRRRLLALFGAALLTLIGAGTGVSNLFGGEDGDGEGGVDLSVDHSVTPDDPTATPTPTPTPGDGEEGADDATGPPERPDTTTETDGGGESDPTPGETPRYDDDPDDDPRSPASVTGTPNGELAAASIPPVSVSDVEPGDGGTVDLSVTLSGSPARLWIRGDVTDVDEGGTSEVERSAGDAGEPGELQNYVQVRVRYDGEDAVFEGTLADLDAREDWIALTEACVVPGTQSIRVRWDLPSDAPNVVQTDGVSFSLGIAADASECA
jgi:hypothetical protein